MYGLAETLAIQDSKKPSIVVKVSDKIQFLDYHFCIRKIGQELKGNEGKYIGTFSTVEFVYYVFERSTLFATPSTEDAQKKGEEIESGVINKTGNYSFLPWHLQSLPGENENDTRWRILMEKLERIEEKLREMKLAELLERTDRIRKEYPFRSPFYVDLNGITY
jgi:hypothetical protein